MNLKINVICEWRCQMRYKEIRCIIKKDSFCWPQLRKDDLYDIIDERYISNDLDGVHSLSICLIIYIPIYPTSSSIIYCPCEASVALLFFFFMGI
ncbi:hypothetical protein Scep_024448 [Stephania cephalantha]|uniref:Uncharacterized protein n=1 Tax=Stephania cephalantha TaxID=152367 RepID=A0AAP0F3S1_9MAGN